VLEAVSRKALAHTEPDSVQADAVRAEAADDSVVATVKAPSRTRSRRRAGTWVLAAIAVAPLLSLLVLLALASAYNPAPANTGDKLLDRLFVDFDRRGGLSWSSETLERMQAQSGVSLESWQDLSPEKAGPLSSIDQDFADDPRYWLLLFNSQQLEVPPHQAALLKQRHLSTECWFLEEARRQGVTSAALLTQLSYRYDSAWTEAAQVNAKESPIPPDKLSQQWPRERWQNWETAYRASAGAELEPFVQELLSSDPNEAGPHYAAARLLTSSGQYDRAQAEIAAGNRCPDTAGFVSAVSSKLWQADQLPAQTLAVQQMAFGTYHSRSMPHFMAWKNCLKKLSLKAAEAEDRAALQELHVFACRFARSGQPTPIQQLVGLVMTGLPATALKQFNPGALSTEDWSGLHHRQTLSDKVKSGYHAQNQMLARMSPLQEMDEMSPAELTLRFELIGLAGGPEQSAIWSFNAGIRQEHLETEYFKQMALPLWAELEKFDYLRLDQYAKRPAKTGVLLPK
jgi:hypothetical protein